jgi:hypothetical protein
VPQHQEDLERLERLRADGALSEGEFQREKTRLLLPARPSVGIRWRVVAGILLATVIAILICVGSLWREPNRLPAAEPTLASNDVAVTEPLASPAVSPAAAPPAEAEDQDYQNAVAAAKKDYSNLPPQILDVLSKEEGADEMCRGGTGDAAIAKWWPVRDRLVTQLQAMGLCFGQPTDQSEADSDWHLCEERDQRQSLFGNAG